MSLSNNALATTMDTINQLYLLQSILINMQSNLILIEEGAAGNIITVQGANLYQLAAQQYGDASEWTTIADANGLTDPVVSGGVLTQVMVVDGGMNYYDPQFSFNPVSTLPVNLQPVIEDGVIVSVIVINGGQFASVPQIFITDESGTGASVVAVCTMQLVIPSVSVSTGGILNA